MSIDYNISIANWTSFLILQPLIDTIRVILMFTLRQLFNPITKLVTVKTDCTFFFFLFTPNRNWQLQYQGWLEPTRYMASILGFKFKQLLISHLLNISYSTISFTLLDCCLQHSFFSELDLAFYCLITHGYHITHDKLH